MALLLTSFFIANRLHYQINATGSKPAMSVDEIVLAKPFGKQFAVDNSAPIDVRIRSNTTASLVCVAAMGLASALIVILCG
jgi:hypothetical protein